MRLDTPPSSTVPLHNVYCLVPPATSSHVLIVTDVLGQWARPVIQATQQSDSPEAALEELANAAHPYSSFWKLVRDSLPVFYAAATPPQTLVSVSLVVVDAVRAFHYGWHVLQDDDPETLDLGQPTPYLLFQDVGTQTIPTYWPAHASATGSRALPQLPAVSTCIPLLQLCPDGPPVTLDCRQFGVKCVLPCLPGYHPWGLRVGMAVFGVCTAEVTWQHVLTIAEANTWDLSGMEIFGEDQLWAWPAEVEGLAGQCGHLLYSGTDPYLTGAKYCVSPTVSRSSPATPNVTVQRPLREETHDMSSGSRGSSMRGLAILGLVATSHRPQVFVNLIALLHIVSAGR